MADPEIRRTFGRPFSEQVAAFRLRLRDQVPTRAWDDLDRRMHDRAFMVAGAMKADLLSDLGQAVDRVIAEGIGLEEFKRDFFAIAERNGWSGWTGDGTKAGRHWRARVIYRTNLRTTYAAGRMAQLREGGYPYWIYFHGGSLEPRLQHLGWNGLVLPSDHPFWATHAPPNGWGCSCYVIGARSLKAARRLGGDPDKELEDGWDRIDPRSGTPEGIDRGWDYAPGAGSADLIRTMARKSVNWDYHLAKAFMTDMPPETADRLATGYRALPSLADSLRRWVERVRGVRNDAPIPGPVSAQPMRTMGLTTRAQAEELRRLSGVDVAGFDFVLDADAVLHIFARHGDEALEAARGQRAVTPEDIGRLGQLIDTPDAVTFEGTDPGQGPMLRYEKGIGGERHVALFAAKAGRRRLKLVTYYILR